jgi:hypothetical protein
MLQLTLEQQQALDAFPEAPARFHHAGTGVVEVLLRSEDFDWIRELLGDEADAPRYVDPRTGLRYAVLAENRYERFKSFFEEDPLTPAERSALRREAGKRAGWHGPEWNRPHV